MSNQPQVGSKQRQADDQTRRQSFCQLQALLGAPREAAIQAGYPPSKAQAEAARLMSDPAITGQIDRYRTAALERNIAHEALVGLQRLAFGSVNDALYLALSEPDAQLPDTRALDLFNVSEIEFGKNGGCKIKFYSRLDAMLALLNLSAGGEETAEPGSPSTGVLHALQQSAKALAVRGGDHGA